MEIFQISVHNRTIHTFFNQIWKMVTFITEKPSFCSILMYIIGKKSFCKTPADFGQISAGVWPGACILAGAGDPVDHCYILILWGKFWIFTSFFSLFSSFHPSSHGTLIYNIYILVFGIGHALFYQILRTGNIVCKNSEYVRVCSKLVLKQR